MLMPPNIQTIAIIGTGLLGASVGLALKQRGYTGEIIGVGRKQNTLDQAKEIGAIDTSTQDIAQAVADSQLVIIAVPLSGFEAIFQQIAGHEHDKLIITDVGSTKDNVLQLANTHLQAPACFVGSHPMAGSEKQGPLAADANLFEGKPCIVCPSEHSREGDVQAVQTLWESLGMHVLQMSAARHDEQTALTSHLPHATAATLVHCAATHGGWDVASTGFASTTRLASSNPPMRSDIMLANRKALLNAIQALEQHLQTLKQHLQTGDQSALIDWLEQAKQTRDNWLETKK